LSAIEPVTPTRRQTTPTVTSRERGSGAKAVATGAAVLLIAATGGVLILHRDVALVREAARRRRPAASAAAGRSPVTPAVDLTLGA